jgi:hypothetical protein
MLESRKGPKNAKKHMSPYESPSQSQTQKPKTTQQPDLDSSYNDHHCASHENGLPNRREGSPEAPMTDMEERIVI